MDFRRERGFYFSKIVDDLFPPWKKMKSASPFPAPFQPAWSYKIKTSDSKSLSAASLFALL